MATLDEGSGGHAHPQARGGALRAGRARRVQPRQVDVRERAVRRGDLAGGHHADDGDDQSPRVVGEAAGDGASHRRHDQEGRPEEARRLGDHRGQGSVARQIRRGRLAGGDLEGQGHARRHAGRQRHQRAARRDHLRVHSARRRRCCSCSTARRCSSSRSASFLEQRILRRSKDKLIFILGKIDLLSPEEREEALKYCRDNLARVVDEPQIFPVSAKRQLSDKEADKAASGFAPFLAHLRKYLADERGRVLLDNGIADGLRTGGYLASNLGIKRRSLQLALEELEERIGRVRAQLDGAQSRLQGPSREDSRRGGRDQGGHAARPRELRQGVRDAAADGDRSRRRRGRQALPRAVHPGHLEGVGRGGGREDRGAARAAGRGDHPGHQRGRGGGDGDVVARARAGGHQDRHRGRHARATTSACSRSARSAPASSCSSTRSSVAC